MFREMLRCTPSENESALGTWMFGSITLTSCVMTSVIGYTGLLGKLGIVSRAVSRSSSGVAPEVAARLVAVLTMRMPGLALKIDVKSLRPGAAVRARVAAANDEVVARSHQRAQQTRARLGRPREADARRDVVVVGVVRLRALRSAA